MQLSSSYIHAIDGRLRIKVTEVKGSPVNALTIEENPRTIDGVKHVKANPMTGNVLILYGSERIGQQEVIAALQRLGYLQERVNARMTTGDLTTGYDAKVFERVGGMLIETLLRSTVELAVQRLVSALI